MASIEYNGWDRFRDDEETRKKFYENKDNAIEYRIFKCNRCGLRHLLKIVNERPVLDFSEEPCESAAYMMMACVRCGMWRWPVMDKVEVVDVY